MLFAAMAVPCVNYLATYQMLAHLKIEPGHPAWGPITASNGIGPLLALAVSIGLALRWKGSPEAAATALPAPAGTIGWKES